jgi:PAS domain S-box-containing protein
MGGWFSSLRFRLVALVLIAVIPAFGLILWTNFQQRQDERAHAGEIAVRITQTVSAQQGQFVEGARGFLGILVGLVGVSGRPIDPEPCNKALAILLQQNPRYANIGIADANGIIVCSGLPSPAADATQRTWFQRAVQTRQFAVGDYQIGTIAHNATVNFGYPMLDSNGQVKGVVFAALDLSWLSAFTAQVKLPKDTTLTVLDRNGVVLARQPDPEIWVGKTVTDRPLGRTVLSVGEGTAELPGLDGKQRLFAFQPLGAAGTHDAFVAVGISTATAYAGINQALIRNLSFLGVVALLALAAAWFGGEWFILRSMRVLVGASQRVGAGDLNARSGLGHDRGEIGQLAGSFDEMAGELQHREMERQRAEQELEGFFAVSPDLLCIASTDGYFKRLSPSWEATLGYPISELLAKPYVEFVHPDDTKATVAENEQLSAQGIDTVSFENRYRRSDGSYRVLSWNCRAARPGETLLYAVARDVTDRKMAERALHESEDRFRSFVEHAADGILMVDERGNIVSANPTAELMFGYPTDEIVGQSVDTLLPTGLRPQHAGHRESFWAAPTARSMGSGLDLKARRRDGSEFPVAISLTPLTSGGERLVAASVADVTEQKRAEEQLEQTVQGLKRSNEELEQFAYVASHDLQEPLRMVGNYTQLLARRYKGKLDTDADEFIAYAVDGAKRMQTLINDLLALSRVSKRGKELVATDAEAVLDRTLRDLGPAAAESGVTITHDPLPMVLADDGQLGQVFQNLIGNAIRFHGDQSPQIHVSAQRDGSGYVFSVKDNGIGIAPEYFERIFVIFQRLHGRESYPGTGIGLAVCKKIVERHGGRIWVESEPGQGAAFYFTMPAAHAALAAA